MDIFKLKILLDQLKSSFFGVSMKEPNVSTYQNSRIKYKNSLVEHNYKLEMPYCGIYLAWEAIFTDDFSFAPDFNFSDDTFLSDPDVDLIAREIPSLANWNVENKDGLVDVCNELLQLYKKVNVDKLQMEKFSKQLSDYNSLIEEMNYSSSDVEVFIDEADTVRFLIKVSITFPELPPYFQEYLESRNNPGRDSMLLHVQYGSNNRATTSSVQFFKSMEELIGNFSNLHIPKFKMTQPIGEYIGKVTEIVMGKLENISSSYKMRNEFVSTVLANHGLSLIEYDSIKFEKITVLLELSDASVLFSINLGKQFPHDKPSIELLSMAYQEAGNNGTKMVKNIPYSQKDSMSVCVSKIIGHLSNTCKMHKDCFLDTTNKLTT